MTLDFKNKEQYQTFVDAVAQAILCDFQFTDELDILSPILDTKQEACSMICPQCNSVFEPKAVNQIYCSRKCERTAMHQRYLNRDEPPTPINARPIDEFICKNCGKTVFVYDRHDLRHVYCSGKCATAYQKKSAEQKRRRCRGNLGFSPGMSLGSLIKRERRDLD